jgi:hypothetical protein
VNEAEIKEGNKSYKINQLLYNLNDNSSNLEILQKFQKMKEKKYGKNYFSGLNIVKYLIRVSEK